jgi:uncharacterized OB-fold protein
MITARYHRETPQRYRLEAGKCSGCGHISFPPRIVCPSCKGRKFETVRLSEDGTLLTYTVVRVASDRFSKETPFAVGIVELGDGVRITTQIADADPDELKTGRKVRMVFRKIQEDGKAGILCYGYKALLV